MMIFGLKRREMMTEYIEREKAMFQIDVADFVRDNDFQGGATLLFYDDVVDRLSDIPAADVRPLVRGKWKPRDLTWGRSYYYCSACEETVGMPTAMGIPMFRYCPNCGADMREES